ncbi:MAG TPA: alpha/beta hydrolase [Myxococcaceae bacterium]|nr:alpha/beta hydrolase [Myxococcaceae bacterium]
MSRDAMPSPRGPRSFRVARPDGAEIHVEVEGRGRSTVVLCDGLACDGFAWKYLRPVLGEHHRVVHWHYRGHGQSPLPPAGAPPSIPQFADDLAGVLDAARVRGAVLLGHSMGVQLALEFHRLHPARTRALVLVSGSPGHPLDTFHDTTLLRRALPSLRKGAERFPRLASTLAWVGVRSGLAMEIAMSTEVNASLLRRGDLQPYFEHVERMDPRYFLRAMQAAAEHGAEDHLTAVDVPTLVVAGDRDRFTPTWLSRRMALEIPSAELFLVRGGSHTALLERPEEVNRAVLDFLHRRVETGRRRSAP